MSAVLMVSATLAGVPIANAVGAGGPDDGGNESPLADAGLDRNVSANVTVFLDATGSRDPDGEVDEYDWLVERPGGGYTIPSCPTCGRTRFVPRETGTYNATVTVTDEDGATSTDTLRINVEPSNGPTVTISGPDSVVEGQVSAYSASVSAGANDLAAVVWRADGRRLNRTTLTGETASVDRLHAFRSDGTVTLSATAVDRLGRERTATQRVTVTEPDTSGGGSVGGGSVGVGSGIGTSSADSESSNGSVGSDSGTACSRYTRNDDRYCDNDRMTLDSDGIVVSDADNDGSTEWAGVELDEEFAQSHDGVSFDSVDGVAKFDSQEAYKEALGVESVNINPDAEVNIKQNREDQGDGTGGNEFGSGDGTGSKNTKNTTDGSNSNTESENSRDIPERVMDRIQDERGGSSSTDQNETNTGDSNTRTGRVPPGQNNGGF
ncbi:hypothetical protein C475_10203 [Halosimplex carlsbadense 2-9-1]|uniref:PKD/Chitinase domain-containing protein n=1 Tax=Halosimplex carlsbadense 2-9-1 TaxID=797114 RepID=M0CT48_9EURY|nr:hypothetical protein C475_10203 [Halosimplex carlsbadense 2-9-1]